jgi:hypothetical protein
LETTKEQPRTKKPREAFGLRALERRFFPAEDSPPFQGFRPPESADKSDALQTLRAARKLSPCETLLSLPAIRLVNNSHWNFKRGVL